MKSANPDSNDACSGGSCYASASGLDPHISPAAAEYQVAHSQSTRLDKRTRASS